MQALVFWLVIGALATCVPCAGVTALKGRWLLTISGLMGIFPLLWVGAFTLAHPESWWARRFYDAPKRERAAARQARWDASWAE